MSQGPATLPQTDPTGHGRLGSWKEIAVYLGRGVRTVQRWEREEGLPIRRLSHDKRGSVYAYKSELDAWWESRSRTTDGQGLCEDLSEINPEIHLPAESAAGLGSSGSLFQFGVFELDLQAGELRQRGVRVNLQDEPLEILGLLIENPGQLVTREQIQEKLWCADTFVDFDNDINGAVSRMRDALGDTLENPRFVETVAKRGYRFIAPVSQLPIAAPPVQEHQSRQFDQRTAADKRIRSWPSAALLLGAVLIVIGSVWLLRGRHSVPESPSLSIPLTSYPGHEVQPSFSPDGNQVVFVWNGENPENPDLYVKLIGGAEKPLRLTSDPAPDLSPAWSPDGRFIAFVRDDAGPGGKSSVFVVPAIGGPERLVAERGSPLAAPAGFTKSHDRIAPFPLLAWAPGGKHLIITDQSSRTEPLGLFAVSLETGEKRRLTSAPAGAIGDAAPAISPDGRNLIFARASNRNVSELYRLRLTGGLAAAGGPERLTSSRAWNTSPAWLSNGRGWIFASGSFYLGPFSLWRMPASAGSVPQRLVSETENSAWPAVSRDKGRLVFSVKTSDTNIWRVPLTNGVVVGTPEKLIASTRDDIVPQYSPDGTRIVFTSNRSGVHEVWTSGSDGSDPVQLTFFGAGMAASPRWSPDGKTIVFGSNVEGQVEIYVIDAAGGRPRRLTHDRADDNLATFSPDGRFIYFSSTRTGSVQVWRMLADGREPVQITRDLGRGPMFSSDGKRIWYDKPNAGLWSLPLDGGQEKRVLESVSYLSASVTDTGIYFIPRCGGARCPTIEFFSFATGNSKPVITVGKTLGLGLTVSPDGRYLVYTQNDRNDSDLKLVEGFR